MSTVKHTTSSLFATVTTVADTASAIINIAGVYAEGWNQRMKLAEDTRLLEAQIEHKAAKILIPQRISADASNEIKSIQNKVNDVELFNNMLSQLTQ